MSTFEVKTYYFEDDGFIPNHPDWPVLFYEGVLAERSYQAEQIFNENNWLNSWRNGIFDYHHYHSNTHEVLGVISGFATVKIGGKSGQELQIHAGDVIVLPAGTGHINMESSADFQVAGAYPNGMDYNLMRGVDGERPAALEEIRNVPLPETDPVFGTDGPLLQHWNRK
ncbi:cupin domain-containing protein [Fictibacillus sp. KU28468]|uniref:cupin domain-containing protein n=2 Tax=unclassified Fictibacillus TaxID=2644029 RepID=UPI00223C9EA9|nr:cupin domain-containing protein [Fictibacillus sp. KU28468]UZJ77958.1 cupin domain-containing protein [Fictibacillus sp. KU28468]